MSLKSRIEKLEDEAVADIRKMTDAELDEILGEERVAQIKAMTDEELDEAFRTGKI